MIARGMLKSSQRVDPVLGPHPRDCFVNEMGVEVEQLWVNIVRIQHTSEVKCFVVLSSGNAAVRFKPEDLFQAVEILGLDVIESEANWDDYEYALAFLNLISYIVKENIAIIADDHAKVCHWLHDLIYLM